MITDLHGLDKQRVVNLFIGWLYAQGMHEAEKELQEIRASSFYLLHDSTPNRACFRYKGKGYFVEDGMPHYKMPYLHENLHQRMDIWLENQNSKELEHEQVKMFITAAMAECESIFQLPDVLPEACHNWFKDLIRETRPEYATVIPQERVVAFHQKQQRNMDVLLARITKNLLGIK
ncbi:hypothetical protein MIF8_2 [Erwinia phage MIF8]